MTNRARPPSRISFAIYAILLGAILLVPWSGWFGTGFTLFRDFVSWTDWREDMPLAAILLGVVASLAGLTRGRVAPAVGAVLTAALFLAAGVMNFGALPALDHFFPNTGGAAMSILLLCLVAAGMRSARRYRDSGLSVRIAGAAGLLLVLQVGLGLAWLSWQSGAIQRQVYDAWIAIPDQVGGGANRPPHLWAVIVSGGLVVASLAAAGIACLRRRSSSIFPALAEALAKTAILVSAAYTLWVDVARAGPPDFIVLLRFWVEIASAVFLLVLIDALSELLPPWQGPVARSPAPSPQPARSPTPDLQQAHPGAGTSASHPLESP